MATATTAKTDVLPIRIDYAGVHEGKHCLRVHLDKVKAFRAYELRNRIAMFILNDGVDATLTNQKLFENAGNTDFFVVFATVIGMRKFQQTFDVMGYTPALVH